MPDIDFDETFAALTENKPFPWQQALYQRFLSDDIPKSCNLPTGLGKTSVIPIWLIALAKTQGQGVPRRLVYVVNRRTVVDQATAEAKKLRDKLEIIPKFDERLKPLRDALEKLCAFKPDPESDPPLAISTLRGQFADNREWSRDPARPAVVVGTVDMIGSRLLFSGYGCGFKTRPLHAGFLGQDSLLVHDEAHLEPAFQSLLVAIKKEQRRSNEFRKFRLMELSATSRVEAGEVDDEKKPPFELTEEERNPPAIVPNPPSEPIHHVWRRLRAKKGVAFVKSERTKLAATIGRSALRHRGSGKAVLIFVRTIDDVKNVRAALTDKKQGVAEEQVQLLTGTIRGLERDRLTDSDPVFARFMPSPKVEPKPGTVYLICTSAGEVGLDISADHMVCDLTTLEAMAQRLGRVNRRGDGQAEVDLIYETDPKDQDDPLQKARWATLPLLQSLPVAEWDPERREAGPLKIGGLIRELTDEERKDAYAPEPDILPTSDILFDAWALTTVRDKLPGRPPVADWLHGVADWQPPETYVAWRDEVRLLSGLLDPKQVADLLEDYPLKPHELLRDRTDRVTKHLESLLNEEVPQPVWVIERDGTVRLTALADLIQSTQKDKEALRDCTVVLPPSVGGLTKDGMLGSDESMSAFDVADEWYDNAEPPNRRRKRGWDAEPDPDIVQMRLVRTVDTRPEAGENVTAEDDEPARRFRRWYVRPQSADDDGSKSFRSRKGKNEQDLDDHNSLAKEKAEQIVTALNLPEPARTAVPLAALHHDDGKRRKVWQVSIGNRQDGKWLAKSGHNLPPTELTGYRHEFGSLLDLLSSSEFRSLDGRSDIQHLALHLIAAHHGRGRPHFPQDESFDPERPEPDAVKAAVDVVTRFGDLQRRYGRWGLAYLESLVRSSDYLASEGRP